MAEQPCDFNKELEFILNFQMIGWKVDSQHLSDGLLTAFKDKQKHKKYFSQLMIGYRFVGFEHTEHSGDERYFVY